MQVYASGLGREDVARTALARTDEGYRAFKFKVGFGPGRDLANFAGIRAALGEDAVVMVDANQAWTPDEARRRIAELAPHRPAWIEEPIAADEPIPRWEALAHAGVLRAAGENLRGIDAFGEALAAEFLAVVQPDVGKRGGLSGCREVALLARRHGALFCPHWLGGGVGLAASLHLRAAMGPAGYAEVDANPNPLREEVFAIRPVDGWVTLPDAPGLGVEPDLARLGKYRVPH